MQDKAILILLGWALCSTGILMYTIWLLYKKPTTHNETGKLVSKTKRNRDSNIKTDISHRINTEGLNTPKKEGIFKRIRNKRKLKKEDKNV